MTKVSNLQDIFTNTETAIHRFSFENLRESREKQQ